VKGVNKSGRRKKADELLELVALPGQGDKMVDELSGGQKQRVAVARALCAEPEVLLLDEPMAGMNLEEKEDMCRFVLDVNEELGTTIVLIEHDMSVVMDISDRVIVLDYGRKISEGKPEAVRNDQKVIDAYLGVPH